MAMMAPALPYLYGLAAAASIATSVSTMTAAKPGSGQQATPAAPKTAAFTTDTQRNTSETQADILRKEQARKSGGVAGNESILTGGLGSLGSVETAGGGKTLLGA